MLFDMKAAFPSVWWEWMGAMLIEMRIPSWVINARRAHCTRPTAQVVYAGILTGSSLEIARGIKQGVPELGLGLGAHLRPGDPTASRSHAWTTQ